MSTTCETSGRQRAAGIDRREFAGFGAASLATALLPLPTALTAAPSVEPRTQTGLLSDWDIDDVWGVYPRYSEAIGYGKPRGAVPSAARGADSIFAEFV